MRLTLSHSKEIFPHPRKRQVGLPYIENDRIIPKQVQIQALPSSRALVNENATLRGDGNGLVIHGMLHNSLRYLRVGGCGFCLGAGKLEASLSRRFRPGKCSKKPQSTFTHLENRGFLESYA
jgi:hypothetical protein